MCTLYNQIIIILHVYSSIKHMVLQNYTHDHRVYTIYFTLTKSILYNL